MIKTAAMNSHNKMNGRRYIVPSKKKLKKNGMSFLSQEAAQQVKMEIQVSLCAVCLEDRCSLGHVHTHTHTHTHIHSHTHACSSVGMNN